MILENEGTEQCPATPVLAFNVTAVVQMFDWTGKVDTHTQALFVTAHMITFAVNNYAYDLCCSSVLSSVSQQMCSVILQRASMHHTGINS